MSQLVSTCTWSGIEGQGCDPQQRVAPSLTGMVWATPKPKAKKIKRQGAFTAFALASFQLLEVRGAFREPRFL